MNMSDCPNVDELIVSVLLGDASSEEVALLNEWISESDANKRYFDEMKQIWDASSFVDCGHQFDWSIPYLKWLSRVRNGGDTWMFRRFWLGYVCAACIGALIFGLLGFLLSRGTSSGVVEAEANVVTVTSPMATLSRVMLPDGSVAVLNGGSSISYTEGFPGGLRTVNMSGKAYFDVTHDSEHPFTVSSGNLKVKVRGTRFTFSDYADDASASVTLVEGKVDVEFDDNKLVTLLPADRLTYNKADRQTVISVVDTIAESLWSQGILLFDEVVLTDVAKVLQQTYGREIEVRGAEAKTMLINGRFSSQTQSLFDILDLFGSTGRVHYTLQGEKIVLY